MISPWYTCILRKIDGLGCNINISVNDLLRFLVGQTEPFRTLGCKTDVIQVVGLQSVPLPLHLLSL